MGLLYRRGWICRKVDASDDPLQEKLWHSGRWLHVIACLGEGREHINIQVVYGIAGNPGLIVLTDANFSFDNFNSIPPAPLVALADGWLIDIDLAHA